MSHSSIAHLAGPDLTVDGRWMRQRCAWCGEVLLDYDLARVAVPVGQPGPSPFEIGKFIEVTSGNPKMSTALDWDSDKLPETACMRFPPEETR